MILGVIKRLPYFLLTVVILGGLGVTLPLAIDYFKNDALTDYSLELAPNNLITYSISIFLVAFVDRMRYLIKDDRYKHKELEFIFLIIGVFGQAVLVFLAFKNIYHEDYQTSLKICYWITGLSFLLWWVVRKNDGAIDPYSALGD